MQNLIELETKTEYLLGNNLNRSQTNFFYQITNKVFEKTQHLNVLNNFDKFTKKALPELIIFKSIIHFYHKILLKKENKPLMLPKIEKEN